MRTARSRPKWALASRTIILNLAMMLVGINELIPVVTQYREVVPIPDAWVKRALFLVAVGNILLRRMTRDPVAFRRRRAKRVSGADAAGAPAAGWDGDPDQAPEDEEAGAGDDESDRR